MSNLKKLSLVHTGVKESWFEEDISFLKNLETLDLHRACRIGSRTFQVLKNYASNLIELYLCGTSVQDSDFSFSNFVFPKLKTVCLCDCDKVTCEGVVSLVHSCRSLQNIYVKIPIVRSYAEHPFVVDNNYKLHIVKASTVCLHSVTLFA